MSSPDTHCQTTNNIYPFYHPRKMPHVTTMENLLMEFDHQFKEMDDRLDIVMSDFEASREDTEERDDANDSGPSTPKSPETQDQSEESNVKSAQSRKSTTLRSASSTPLSPTMPSIPEYKLSVPEPSFTPTRDNMSYSDNGISPSKYIFTQYSKLLLENDTLLQNILLHKSEMNKILKERDHALATVENLQGELSRQKEETPSNDTKTRNADNEKREGGLQAVLSSLVKNGSSAKMDAHSFLPDIGTVVQTSQAKVRGLQSLFSPFPTTKLQFNPEEKDDCSSLYEDLVVFSASKDDLSQSDKSAALSSLIPVASEVVREISSLSEGDNQDTIIRDLQNALATSKIQVQHLQASLEHSATEFEKVRSEIDEKDAEAQMKDDDVSSARFLMEELCCMLETAIEKVECEKSQQDNETEGNTCTEEKDPKDLATLTILVEKANEQVSQLLNSSSYETMKALRKSHNEKLDEISCLAKKVDNLEREKRAFEEKASWFQLQSKENTEKLEAITRCAYDQFGMSESEHRNLFSPVKSVVTKRALSKDEGSLSGSFLNDTFDEQTVSETLPTAPSTDTSFVQQIEKLDRVNAFLVEKIATLEGKIKSQRDVIEKLESEEKESKTVVLKTTEAEHSKDEDPVREIETEDDNTTDEDTNEESYPKDDTIPEGAFPRKNSSDFPFDELTEQLLELRQSLSIPFDEEPTVPQNSDEMSYEVQQTDDSLSRDIVYDSDDDSTSVGYADEFSAFLSTSQEYEFLNQFDVNNSSPSNKDLISESGKQKEDSLTVEGESSFTAVTEKEAHLTVEEESGESKITSESECSVVEKSNLSTSLIVEVDDEPKDDLSVVDAECSVVEKTHLSTSLVDELDDEPKSDLSIANTVTRDEEFPESSDFSLDSAQVTERSNTCLSTSLIVQVDEESQADFSMIEESEEIMNIKDCHRVDLQPNNDSPPQYFEGPIKEIHEPRVTDELPEKEQNLEKESDTSNETNEDKLPVPTSSPSKAVILDAISELMRESRALQLKVQTLESSFMQFRNHEQEEAQSLREVYDILERRQSVMGGEANQSESENTNSTPTIVRNIEDQLCRILQYEDESKGAEISPSSPVHSLESRSQSNCQEQDNIEIEDTDNCVEDISVSSLNNTHDEQSALYDSVLDTLIPSCESEEKNLDNITDTDDCVPDEHLSVDIMEEVYDSVDDNLVASCDDVPGAAKSFEVESDEVDQSEDIVANTDLENVVLENTPSASERELGSMYSSVAEVMFSTGINNEESDEKSIAPEESESATSEQEEVALYDTVLEILFKSQQHLLDITSDNSIDSFGTSLLRGLEEIGESEDDFHSKMTSPLAVPENIASVDPIEEENGETFENDTSYFISPDTSLESIDPSTLNVRKLSEEELSDSNEPSDDDDVVSSESCEVVEADEPAKDSIIESQDESDESDGVQVIDLDDELYYTDEESLISDGCIKQEMNEVNSEIEPNTGSIVQHGTIEEHSPTHDDQNDVAVEAYESDDDDSISSFASEKSDDRSVPYTETIDHTENVPEGEYEVESEVDDTGMNETEAFSDVEGEIDTDLNQSTQFETESDSIKEDCDDESYFSESSERTDDDQSNVFEGIGAENVETVSHDDTESESLEGFEEEVEERDDANITRESEYYTSEAETQYESEGVEEKDESMNYQDTEKSYVSGTDFEVTEEDYDINSHCDDPVEIHEELEEEKPEERQCTPDDESLVSVETEEIDNRDNNVVVNELRQENQNLLQKIMRLEQDLAIKSPSRAQDERVINESLRDLQSQNKRLNSECEVLRQELLVRSGKKQQPTRLERTPSGLRALAEVRDDVTKEEVLESKVKEVVEVNRKHKDEKKKKKRNTIRSIFKKVVRGGKTTKAMRTTNE